MKIIIEKNIVELVPENKEETSSLTSLWRIMIDCMGENKMLNPIGEYIPEKKNLARFVIEGVPGGITERIHGESAAEDATYLCAICNKYMKVKAGEDLPMCCGKIMENMD
ncbi:MAG: hypothetical protein BM485_16545 [Desulfobulbaceae bacterium DB1]|nr:MAG: hypothetical protein BM485_16545 [Desulfobulbaceae bacterium DB1]